MPLSMQQALQNCQALRNVVTATEYLETQIKALPPSIGARETLIPQIETLAVLAEGAMANADREKAEARIAGKPPAPAAPPPVPPASPLPPAPEHSEQ